MLQAVVGGQQEESLLLQPLMPAQKVNSEVTLLRMMVGGLQGGKLAGWVGPRQGCSAGVKEFGTLKAVIIGFRGLVLREPNTESYTYDRST